MSQTEKREWNLICLKYLISLKEAIRIKFISLPYIFFIYFLNTSGVKLEKKRFSVRFNCENQQHLLPTYTLLRVSFI